MVNTNVDQTGTAINDHTQTDDNRQIISYKIVILGLGCDRTIDGMRDEVRVKLNKLAAPRKPYDF